MYKSFWAQFLTINLKFKLLSNYFKKCTDFPPNIRHFCQLPSFRRVVKIDSSWPTSSIAAAATTVPFLFFPSSEHATRERERVWSRQKGFELANFIQSCRAAAFPLVPATSYRANVQQSVVVSAFFRDEFRCQQKWIRVQWPPSPVPEPVPRPGPRFFVCVRVCERGPRREGIVATVLIVVKS